MTRKRVSLPVISTNVEVPENSSSISSNASSPQSQRSSILVESPQTPMTTATTWDSSSGLDSSMIHSLDGDMHSPLLRKVLTEDLVSPVAPLGYQYDGKSKPGSKLLSHLEGHHDRGDELELVLTNDVLGHGSFCRVVKACSVSTGKFYAVKMAQQSSQSSILKHEAQILFRLGEHRNIVNHYGLLPDSAGTGSGLILELYPQSMANYVTNTTPSGDNSSPFVGLDLWLDWTLQLCEALSFLQSNKVVHCDLKTDNILLAESNTPIIADFSSSHTTDELATSDSVHLSSTAFSFEFSAPELLADPDLAPNFSTDLYSLGLIMLHVATGNEPYHRAIKSFPQKLLWAKQGAALKVCSAEDVSRLSSVMTIMHSFLTTRVPLTSLIEEVQQLQ